MGNTLKDDDCAPALTRVNSETTEHLNITSYNVFCNHLNVRYFLTCRGGYQAGVHKTGIRGIQDTRQIVDGKTNDIENNNKKGGSKPLS